MKKIIKALVILIAFSVVGSISSGLSVSAQESEIESVNVATSGSGLPYSVFEEDGNWIGIDADVWRAIEEATGWDVEVQRADFASVFGELDTGRADVAANSFAINEERISKYLYTIPYFGDAQGVYVNGDNETVQTFEDLEGLRVGVTNGQAAQYRIEDLNENIEFEIVTYENSDLMFQDLSLGRIDAFGHNTTKPALFQEQNQADFRMLEEILEPNDVVFYIANNEKGEQLVQELNIIIEELIADGTIAEITQEYVGLDLTEFITNSDATSAQSADEAGLDSESETTNEDTNEETSEE